MSPHSIKSNKFMPCVTSSVSLSSQKEHIRYCTCSLKYFLLTPISRSNLATSAGLRAASARTSFASFRRKSSGTSMVWPKSMRPKVRPSSKSMTLPGCGSALKKPSQRTSCPCRDINVSNTSPKSTGCSSVRADPVSRCQSLHKAILHRSDFAPMAFRLPLRKASHCSFSYSSTVLPSIFASGSSRRLTALTSFSPRNNSIPSTRRLLSSGNGFGT
mmetsp:Transcript_54085/g.150407  ORF Transcript_54085/g.150407 Transcript_54085/m.150407 type:complete len:216 (-) Transcript_54085:997-1644(-)